MTCARRPLCRIAAAALVALPAVAAPRARAQEPVHRFTVTTRGAMVQFDRAASLKPTGLLGVDAEFGVNRYVGVMTSLSAAHPTTRGEDFITTITYGQASGDTTLFFYTPQSVNLIDADLAGVFRYPMARLTPFAVVGVGYYGLFLDPQISKGAHHFNGASFTLGAGAAYQLTKQVGLQIDVRSVTLSRYDASALNPSGGRDPNVAFIEDFPTPPSRRSSVSNYVFNIGFRYVPQAGGGPITPVEENGQ